ncbi:MAG: TolC family protein [Burkholderiaceae bacterium]|nr:TolC family protein [Burkholderiaceae bacterium]
MPSSIRPFALRPIAAALATAVVALGSGPSIAQPVPPPNPVSDTRDLVEAARRAPRNDLLQIYREAVANDAAFAASRYQQQAAQELVPQARSALLPNIGANARADNNYFSTTEPDNSNNYSVYGGGINLSMPLYRPQNWEALEQAKIAVMRSDLTLQQSAQDLTLRVATAYFNVLAARDQLIALEAAKRATLEQLQQARREFEVGTKTIIDTNEAQARYDQIVAQEQVALGTLLVRRSELQTIIGRDLGTLAPLRDRPNLTLPQPNDIMQWVRSAEDTNYSVQIARANYEIAAREVQRQRDAYKHQRRHDRAAAQRAHLHRRPDPEPSARVAVAAGPVQRGARVGAAHLGQRGARRLHGGELRPRAGQGARVRRGLGADPARLHAAGLPGRRPHSARRAERHHAAGADAARPQAATSCWPPCG